MEIGKSHIVRAVAGREKGQSFFVTGRDGAFFLLADGKGRRLEKPKRKAEKHLRYEGEADPATAEAIKSGAATNRMLIKSMAAFKAAGANDKGGTDVWRKTM